MAFKYFDQREAHRKKDPDEYRIYKWKASDMMNAVVDVKQNNMSVGRAAKLHKVTKGVLQKIIEYITVQLLLDV